MVKLSLRLNVSLCLSESLWLKEESSRAARIKWKISSKAQKERRPTKTQKRDDVSKSRGLKSRKTRVQKPKKEIRPKTFNKINMLTKTQNKYYQKKMKKRRRLVYIRK
jgi:protein subunit release factor B